MISLSDNELAAIMDAAAPLQPHQRSDFLRDVSSELAKYEVVGAGTIGRVIAKLQREHLASGPRPRADAATVEPLRFSEGQRATFAHSFVVFPL